MRPRIPFLAKKMNEYDIAAPLAAALAAKGYASLTSVQQAVLAPEARGRDLLVSAQTGSGKTVAFGIAMAENLLDDGTLLPQSGLPLALASRRRANWPCRSRANWAGFTPRPARRSPPASAVWITGPNAARWNAASCVCTTSR